MSDSRVVSSLYLACSVSLNLPRFMCPVYCRQLSQAGDRSLVSSVGIKGYITRGKLVASSTPLNQQMHAAC